MAFTPEELAAAEKEAIKIENYIKVAKTVYGNKELGIQPPPHLLATAYMDIVMEGEQIPKNLIKT